MIISWPKFYFIDIMVYVILRMNMLPRHLILNNVTSYTTFDFLETTFAI